MLGPVINSHVTPSIPLDIRTELVNPFTPWEVSKELFARLQLPTPQAKYKKARVLPNDKEWRFIWRYFHFQKPLRYGIKQVHFVHERHQQKSFEFAFASIEQEAETFPPTWNQESRALQRAQAIQRWRESAQIFSPFISREDDGRKRNWKATKIVPLWHGTNESVCDSICSSGFVYFGKNTIPGGNGVVPKSTDDGYFGSGIYFTNSARYAADIYSRGHLLLGWVSMREPFPVVGDPNQVDMQTLRGKSAYKNYNAHYVPVASIRPQDVDCPEYHPVNENQPPSCDEYVIFQKFQALPQYWLELEVELPYIQIPNKIPRSVSGLISPLMKILQNPEIDEDSKLRDFLNQHLSILLQLPLNEDLVQEQIDLYEQMINLLTPQGTINKFVRNQMFAIAPPNHLIIAQAQRLEGAPKLVQNLPGEEKEPPIKKQISVPGVVLAQATIQPQKVFLSKMEVLAAVQRDGMELKNVSEQFKNDRQVVLTAIGQNELAIEFASEQLKNDREFMLIAVQKWGGALQFASEQLKNDREFMLIAVQKWGGGLQFANEQLKNDREIVLAAVQQHGWALQYASEQLKNDREIVIAAEKQTNDSFQFAGGQLNDDREAVLACLQQGRVDMYGSALYKASERLKNDGELVLVALQKGMRFKYVSQLLTNDREFMIKALRIGVMTAEVLECAREQGQLTNDRKFIFAAFQQNPAWFSYASKQLKSDREFVLTLVKIHGDVIYHASEQLKEDREIALAAVKQNRRAFYHLSDSLRKDKKLRAIADGEPEPSCVIS